MDGLISLTSLNCERYFTTFSFSSNGGSLRASFKGKGKRYIDGRPHDLVLGLFSDEDWPKYVAALKSGSLCAERMNLATNRKQMKIIQPPSNNQPSDQGFEFQIVEDFHPSTRSHYYYFVLSDCSLEFCELFIFHLSLVVFSNSKCCLP